MSVATDMVCFLLNSDDQPGRMLARALKQISAKQIQLISAEELVYAPHIRCGFRHGQAFFSFVLQNGLSFSSDQNMVVLNRVSYLPLLHLRQFRHEDQAYVQAEMQALFTFIFSLLPHPVFNAATGRGLCGAERTAMEWALLAKKAGFCIAETIYEEKHHQHFGGNATPPAFPVIVFNGRCYSSSSLLTQEACRSLLHLLQLSGENIIEVFLQVAGDTLRFDRATVKPGFSGINKCFLADLNQCL